MTTLLRGSATRHSAPNRMRFHLLATTLVLAASAACGDSSPTAVPIEQTVFATSLGVDLAQSTKLPSGVYYRDVTTGTGATLATGQTVAMRYAGFFVNGQEFDSNPAPKPVFSFSLGAGQVIRGWDVGLVGMKVGGRRQLIIPPEMGYGPNDYGPIPGNSVLVFTVDAVSAQ
jgi:peptidylprolyl isomerase